MIHQLNETFNEEILALQEEIVDIYMEESNKKDSLALYAKKVAGFLGDMFSLESEINEAYFADKTFDELLDLNHKYYEDIAGDNYLTSYANPDVTTEMFGREIGQVLATIYFRIRGSVAFAFEGRQVSIMWTGGLFVKAYERMKPFRDNLKDKSEVYLSLVKLLKEEASNNREEKMALGIYRRFNPAFNIYSKIASLPYDRKNIFRYGMYIGDNEIKLLDYFESLPEEKLQKIADTYTEAFIRGFERNNVSLDGKKTVNVGYHIGFEPIIKKAYENLQAHGLVPVVHYEISGSPRPRIINTKPSPQMEYDHKFDDGLYNDQALCDEALEITDQAYTKYQDLLKQFAGPAVMEVFGDTPFEPVSKDTTVKYSKELTEILKSFTNSRQQILNRFLPRSAYSFVLISFPIPEIGDQFAEIFDATIEVNTLDEAKYMDIQGKIIDALDQGRGVHITGRRGNKTDLFVAFNQDFDKAKQTNFVNCTADVNVPVGEVFTSPQLEGTKGKLHVSEVFLHGLNYKELEINFEEGMMVSYSCKNFDDEEKNQDFIKENLTHPYESLPLGEFAIGTNTTAYAMAKKYKIDDIIPILIGEKMGPHFAVGDTCFVWSEEIETFNPDGREIVGKENTKTRLRNEKPSQAYTYCHTDITIPYKELGHIIVQVPDGEDIPIIKDGRFVLPGTEALNEPLKDIEV